MQQLPGAAPIAGMSGGIHFRNDVAERTTQAVAEGNAAGEAAFRLAGNFFRRQRSFHLRVVVAADGNRAVDIGNSFHRFHQVCSLWR